MKKMRRLKIKDNKIEWFKKHYDGLGFWKHIVPRGAKWEDIYSKYVEYEDDYGNEYECKIVINHPSCTIPFEVAVYVYSEEESDGIDILINLEELHELYDLCLVELYEVE